MFHVGGRDESEALFDAADAELRCSERAKAAKVSPKNMELDDG